MAGPNTTGKPNTDDYNLGRGCAFFAPLDAVTELPQAYRDLGNAPEFNITVETETLEHQSSRQGLKVTDKEVTISQKINLSFQLDEINHENLAEFFSGEKATHVNVAVAGFVQYAMIPDPTVELGKWYDIRDSAGDRAYDIEAGDFAAETSNGTPVPLVLNTDYELDLEMGRVFLLSTSSVVATAISGSEDINVTLTAEVTAKDVNEVRALTKTSVSGALKFIAENPADNDKQTEFQFHKVSLKADGDFALIGDEFTVMGFTAIAETNETASPDSPTLTIRTVAAA